ncbi:MAG: hypothetical protein HYS80_01855 [Candidatus Aenigmarchaeota archaeon]|nr:hypothetical protein [Candidatus Aenigmarchaeota archaeon]
MADIPPEDIKSHILWKLHVKRIWGAKHTAIENVAKGIPKHLHGSYLGITKELIREGFILTKPASYGLQISLNPIKLNEIIKIVTDFANKHKKFLI